MNSTDKSPLIIFVSLLNENVLVWRPVLASHVKANAYQISEQNYPVDIETWQFVPGDTVVCDIVSSSDGPILAAISKL